MLIPEVFASILQNLSRTDLETLQLVDPYCLSVVEQNFTNGGPLRPISAFKVRGQGRYRLEVDSDAMSVELQGSHELIDWLKSAVIKVVTFSEGVAMDERFLSAIPHIQDVCPILRCDIRAFSSSDVCERALGVFRCEEIQLDSVPFPLANPLMTFAGVQHCRNLFMAEVHCPVDAAAVALWLHREKKWDKHPTLVLHEANVNVHLLLKILKDAFVTAKEARSYKLRICAPSAVPVIEEVRLSNEDSSERMKIITRHEYFIIVERATNE